MWQLADLSFRGNARAVETTCRLERQRDELGNLVELPAGASGASEDPAAAGDDDDEDDVLSTASDADLLLPDRDDPSGMLRTVMRVSGGLLLLLLLLRAGQELDARPPAPLVPDTANPYELLGVPRDASLADINRAYRVRSREVHPDSCKAAQDECAARYTQLHRAVARLRDPREREALDRALPPTWGELAPVAVALVALAAATRAVFGGRDTVPAEDDAATSESERAAHREAKRRRFEARQQRLRREAELRAAALRLQAWWARRGSPQHLNAYAKRLRAEAREAARTMPRAPRPDRQLGAFLVRLLAVSVAWQVGKLLFARVLSSLG